MALTVEIPFWQPKTCGHVTHGKWNKLGFFNIHFRLLYVYQIQTDYYLLRAAMKASTVHTCTRYSSKAPETLTSRFPNRMGKTEARKTYNEQQQQKKKAAIPNW